MRTGIESNRLPDDGDDVGLSSSSETLTGLLPPHTNTTQTEATEIGSYAAQVNTNNTQHHTNTHTHASIHCTLNTHTHSHTRARMSSISSSVSVCSVFVLEGQRICMWAAFVLLLCVRVCVLTLFGDLCFFVWVWVSCRVLCAFLFSS